MRSEWLEYFVDAVRFGSIKASADKHFISPQGLSRSIGSLEKELGVKLFARGANSVRLTPDGEKLLPRIRNATQANHDVVSAARVLAEKTADVPQRMLCSTFVFLGNLMTPLRAALAESDVNVSFVQVDTDRMFDMILSSQTHGHEDDIALGMPILFSTQHAENKRRLAQLREHKFAYRPYERHCDGILVSKDHPLARNESVSREEISQYPVIASSAEQPTPLKTYLGASHVTMEITDIATRMQMIRDNRCIMFLPPFFDAARADEDFRFIRLSEAYYVETGIIFNEALLTEDRITPILRAFASFYENDARLGLLELLVS